MFFECDGETMPRDVQPDTDTYDVVRGGCGLMCLESWLDFEEVSQRSKKVSKPMVSPGRLVQET